MPKGVKTEMTDEQRAAKKAERETEKRTKFLELVNPRVQNALDKIALIGNLSNTNAYTYTPEEAEAMYKALLDEVNRTMGRFQPAQSGKSSGGFSIQQAVQTDDEGEETGETE